MTVIILGAVFLLGTIIGSFLNVLVVRSHDGISLGGRSHCVYCHKQIPNKYLIPILGYFLTGRKCFSCKKEISVRYVLGEILLGVLFILTYMYIQKVFFTYTPGVLFIAGLYFLLTTMLFFISYYDILYQEIPTLVLVLILINIVTIRLVEYIVLGGSYSWGHVIFSLISGSLVAVPFLAIWLISRGKIIGLGDVLIMILIGIHLGLFLGSIAIIISFWIGSIFGIVWIIYKKYIDQKKYSEIRKIPIPFGPFLCTGWLSILFFGFYIVSIFIPGF